MPSYIDKAWTRFYGANVAPKLVEAPLVWKGSTKEYLVYIMINLVSLVRVLPT